ncbi:hypothetical protein L1049_008567 [Liquidambar formosana]|uniref:Disease resistance N-terminal domain-containing protein n=1 Tax=Liquidambar formosana TaxID=63359 RepID=A0AAP0S6K9_LIQFO
MAETILSVLVEGVLEKIVFIPLSEISLAWGVKKEPKKLEKTLSTVKAILSDAEKQQTRKDAVRDWLEKLKDDWLEKLKDVVYDVDDVLDELSTEALRGKVEIHGSLLKEVNNFFSRSNPIAFRYKIGHKIKEIRERLDDIAKDRRDFQFTEQFIDAPIEYGVREQTHSFVQECDVIGRDHDKEQIVQLLLRSSNDGNVSVIPFVGLGGLGKTTLQNWCTMMIG